MSGVRSGCLQAATEGLHRVGGGCIMHVGLVVRFPGGQSRDILGGMGFIYSTIYANQVSARPVHLGMFGHLGGMVLHHPAPGSRGY